MLLRPIVLAALVYFSVSTVLADNSILHFRTGSLSAAYGGDTVSDGNFTLPSALDTELELFMNTKSALIFRSILGIDMSTSQTRYLSASAGVRHYFRSIGHAFRSSDDGATLSVSPKWKYYAGYEGGVAQVLVVDFNRVLSTYSTLFEIGLNIGAVWQASRNVGVETQIGYTNGFGFSNVSVSGNSLRAFLGVTYQF